MKFLVTVAIFTIIISSHAFSQLHGKYTYLDSLPQPVIFYGYDLTHLKLVDTSVTASDVKGFVFMISNHMKKTTMTSEAHDFFKMGVIKNSFNYTSVINNAVTDSTILSVEIPVTTSDSLQNWINSYKIGDSSGTGMVVIYNYFDRKTKSVLAHTILFDIKSRIIINDVEMKSVDKGFYVKLDKWRGAAALNYLVSIEKLNFRANPVARIEPTSVSGKIFIGPTFGTGSNTISGASGSQVRLHIQGGISSEYRFNPKLQLQTYLIASTKGMGSTTFNADTRVRLLYSDLIVNLKYTMTKYFYIGVGAQTGYLLKSNYRYLAYGTDYYDDYNIDKYTNDFDYGINFCLGFRFANGNNLELSYLRGVRQIFNDKSNEPFQHYNGPPRPLPDYIKGTNSVISVSITGLIRVKK